MRSGAYLATISTSRCPSAKESPQPSCSFCSASLRPCKRKHPAPALNGGVKSVGAAHAAPPSAYNAHPKLVIILVIDQFRGDYLERYRADFKGHGFRLFLDQGAYFPDCYYDYANTKTAPGHSTIGTGAYSDGHGIANNDWWDLSRNTKRQITSVEDERYALVGVPASAQGKTPAPGASPRNLRASTVGDELRLATNGRSKVFGISLKDRASILPSGSAANARLLDRPGIRRLHHFDLLPAAIARLGRRLQCQRRSRPGRPAGRGLLR